MRWNIRMENSVLSCILMLIKIKMNSNIEVVKKL
jgi:hypothetical protein